MTTNRWLNNAKKERNDEFYTKLKDIEKELVHYEKHFRNKVIYCNCDDPQKSNFYGYFIKNFNRLGLKRLICTCYSGESEQVTFMEKDYGIPYKAVINSVDDALGVFENKENELSVLNGNGDFRSDECVELLKESDIAVTNPPFSLFKEYISLIVKYDKKFLVIGNNSAITYKEFFPLLKDNRAWIGYNAVPEFTTMNGLSTRAPAIWFTNLEIEKRHRNLELHKTYDPEKYPRYDNYDAINVDKVSDIPYDYDGVMGVPITFVEKHNPEQFELLDANEYMIPKGKGGTSGVADNVWLNGRKIYRRVLIRKV